MSWIMDLKGDGEPPTVVQYVVLFPWKHYGDLTVYCVTSLDCKGRSMQKPKRWWRYGFGRIRSGVVSYFDGCGIIIWGYDGVLNVFNDLRTQKQIIDACCPPQLMAAFLSTDRTSN